MRSHGLSPLARRRMKPCSGSGRSWTRRSGRRSVRLLAIKPVNFRAFGPMEWISLDSDLVVVRGANGAGKTSLAEATSWLLFGETRRKVRGEDFSKVEYRGSYANVHADGNVEVSARVRLRDGTVHVLSRHLTTGRGGAEGSQTFVDGERREFDSLSIPSGYDYYPIVTQHGLQDFIHAGPKERRDAFNSMLGLESLSAYKTALDRARSSFQRSLPVEVAEARAILRSVRARLSSDPTTSYLVDRWDEDFKDVRFPVDWQAVVVA